MVGMEKHDQSIQTKVALEEDFEFRDLVSQTLEKNGALAKIRATLRASICLAVDEDAKLSQLEPLQNSKVQSCLETAEGRVMFNVVREFLEYFNLYETLMVYDSETSLGSFYKYGGKQKTQKDLGLDNTEELNIPILEHILHIAQSKSKILDINLNISNVNSTKESIANDNSYSYESSDSKLTSFNDDDTKKVKKMNATYDINSPTSFKEKNSTFVKNRTSLDSVSEDDTVNSPMFNFNNGKNATCLNHKTSLESLQESIREDQNTLSGMPLSVVDENISYPIASDQDLSELKPPFLLEATKTTAVKSYSLKDELSQALAKNQPNLNSLSDLPPLPMNKSDLLPPMNRDVKKKSNLRELDKMFDLTNDYADDFDLPTSKEFSLSRENIGNKTDSDKTSCSDMSYDKKRIIEKN